MIHESYIHISEFARKASWGSDYLVSGEWPLEDAQWLQKHPQWVHAIYTRLSPYSMVTGNTMALQVLMSHLVSGS